MSYEMYRNQLVLRLTDKLPAKLLNNVLLEIDLLSQDYKIERACYDLITVEEIPQIVKVYIASLAVANCSKSTLSGYRRELLKFFKSIRKPFTSITSNDIRCYLFQSQQERHLKANTVENHRVIINAFYNWLLDNEYISRNPAKVIKPTKVPKQKLPPMKQIELEYFRKACETDREKALVDFLFATGCRVTEAANATIDDINWNDRSFKIRHGKGDKERVTYFNAEAEVSLRKYLDSRKGNDIHLFVATRYPYEKLSRNSLEADIRRIRNRIPEFLSLKVSPHTFRRTMGTMAVDRGCPIERVKELLGHESLDTTMQYVTVSQSETRYAHQKYLS